MLLIQQNMKTKKTRIVGKPKENRKKPLPRARQDLKKAKVKMEPWEWREEETRKLLLTAKRKLPELKVLLAYVSDHWHYEDPIYRFYHHSFKVLRAQTITLKIIETLQSLAPHLKLNPDFLEIAAEGTSRPASSERAIIEALFHARHMLSMLCKYAEELPEPPPVLPSGWATVLYLYNIR
jgi:hypothetical protein